MIGAHHSIFPRKAPLRIPTFRKSHDTMAIGGTRLRTKNQSSVQAIGGTRLRAIGGTRLRADEENDTQAIGGTRLRAIGGTRLRAIGGTRLRADEENDTQAIGGTRLRAIGGTRLRAIGGTRLRADEENDTQAIGGTRLRAIGGTRLRAIGGTRLRADEENDTQAIGGTRLRAIGGTRLRAIGGTRLRADEENDTQAIGGTRLRAIGGTRLRAVLDEAFEEQIGSIAIGPVEVIDYSTNVVEVLGNQFIVAGGSMSDLPAVGETVAIVVYADTPDVAEAYSYDEFFVHGATETIISGEISASDPSTATFQINGYTIDYSQLLADGDTEPSFSVGSFAIVRGVLYR
jgi:hypothetical protein